MILIKPEQLIHSHITRLHKLEKGTVIYSQGDKANEFYYVESGLIGLYHVLENGKESLLRIYSSQDYFGFRTVFGTQIYHCTAKVLLPAEIVRISPHNVSEFIQANPQMIQYLLHQLSEELQFSEQRLAKAAYMRSLDRVMESITHLTQYYPNYPWTYREIAEYSGCETETAIRISKELKKQGFLKQ
ncbi:Crp/Fnr family transcriptional regulator [Conservatibacter flavescens]|uniref:Crp/Fnr family transcriptional regulator n=2 Tax=Conservatibacter flavescens TaxID=28161 RepID=A0A2M8S633_9PAST|nr:Crp/Fnr family transcriptional regulator [Conservatibacter flavescens]PJG86606.1 Crp/Fnr family transcriptional regulator [Conservatibacter flavescens]